MVMAILCPSLPIILKFSTDVVWPVTLLCSNIVMVPSGALCIFPQRWPEPAKKPFTSESTTLPSIKHWQIQPTTYLGQGSVFHPRTEN